MASDDNPLLHIFEVEVEGKVVHLVGFLRPEVAEREGIPPAKVVGEFTPDPEGEFDPKTFAPNPTFIQKFVQFMNEQALHDESLMNLAADKPDELIWLADPRMPRPEGENIDPPPHQLVGRYKVDPDGFFVPEPFRYNPRHRWFDPETGVSGVFENRRFYDWLNPEAA